jgi:hypothetical protein
MGTDRIPHKRETQMSSDDQWNQPCDDCGTALVSTIDRDFFGPGYHYYSLRCPTCRPIAESNGQARGRHLMARFSCGECGSHEEPKDCDAHQYGICDACFDSYREPVDRPKPLLSNSSERVLTYDERGEPHEDVLRTRSGKELTDEDIRRFAEETVGTTSKRYQAGGIGCAMTVHVRAQDAEAVEALSRFLPYGPEYRRGVLEALTDYSREVGRGLDAQADHWLREAKLAGGIA